MNKYRKIFLGFLLLCVVFRLCTVNCLAAEEPYTYALSFYAGKQGTFVPERMERIQIIAADKEKIKTELNTGRDKITISGLKLGDQVIFPVDDMIQLPKKNAGTAQEKDSKYYVQGIRQSGFDNDTVNPEAITVESDRDYVVAYGIQGEMVPYTVRYEDADGNTLFPYDTYYGNAGDKPVVAYRYLDGWVPRAYNITKTLSSEPGENVFIFVYDRGEAGAVIENLIDGGTTIVTVPGGPTVLPGTDAGAGGGGGALGGADGGDENLTDIPDEQVPQAPEQLQNLDDEEVPLASLKDLFVNSEGRFVYWASFAIAAAAVGTLAGMLVWKKKHNEKEIEE